jgi:hypothetical protein
MHTHTTLHDSEGILRGAGGATTSSQLGAGMLFLVLPVRQLLVVAYIVTVEGKFKSAGEGTTSFQPGAGII